MLEFFKLSRYRIREEFYAEVCLRATCSSADKPPRNGEGLRLHSECAGRAWSRNARWTMRRSRDDIGANSYGAPRLAHSVRCHARRQTQFFEAHPPVVHAVEADFLVLVTWNRSISSARNSTERSNSPPRSRSNDESGPDEFHQNFGPLPVPVLLPREDQR